VSLSKSVLCYDSATQSLRSLFGTRAGLALIAGVLIKLLAFVVGLLSAPLAHDIIDTTGDLCVLGGGAVILFRLFRTIRARLLWRVRRKLILSYIFIGVVPAILLVVFFLLAGLLVFYNVSSYITQTRLRAVVQETGALAQGAALELEGATPAQRAARLERRRAAAEARFPGASFAVLPARDGCAAGGVSTLGEPVTAGGWSHLAAPVAVPDWVPCDGFAGLFAYVDAADPSNPNVERRTHLLARAIATPDVATTGVVVLVDVPIGDRLMSQLRNDSGIAMGEVTAFNPAGSDVQPLAGTELPQRVGVRIGSGGVFAPGEDPAASQGLLRRPLEWVSLLEYTDWSSGRTGGAMVAIRMSIAEMYSRISSAPITRLGNLDFGNLILLGLAVVAGSFLVIVIIAGVTGFALARSITGSVHELFAGTERVRQGDFTQKIAIHSRDQLGELAESFNSMTASIEDLLIQKAEKERLEEELRIARQIQMSLLPQGPLLVPGLALSGHCEPAREVGGDYYDFLPLSDGRVGVLIADVAGKGTSAALYMAELKGLMLSLSELHRSPRQLLIDANRIISHHLDDRSFITVTYAVLDVPARTITYARAGHCPLIYRPGPAHVDRRPQVIVPNRMVLGLHIDRGAMFEELLEEVTLPLGSGDLFLLFTDGITEAMNSADDCFGEARSSAIVEDHGDGPPELLRERILREIHGFTSPAAPHDDMTMLLIKVDGAAADL
jgi:sigma-B regulation protein RsbU (phosphoserine phosphatase)